MGQRDGALGQSNVNDHIGRRGGSRKGSGEEQSGRWMGIRTEEGPRLQVKDRERNNCV